MSLSVLKQQIKTVPWLFTSLKVLQKTLRSGPDSARRYLRDNRALREAFLRPERLPKPEPIPEETCFSLLVPLYNTPERFLREMLESVLRQTYPRWQLCLADGSDEGHGEVEALCREYAARDGRVAYRRLARNEGISANTNACLRMAEGDYIALLDHDDLLHPHALYYAARAIRQEGADFVYTDEAIFLSPDPARITLIHHKPDFAPDDLLAVNYICHFTVFAASLLQGMEAFRPCCDGSQDHDLFLRLTARAKKIVHIPRILYLWRSHPQSSAQGVEVKGYAAEASRRAIADYVRAAYGAQVQVSVIPEGVGSFRLDWPLRDDASPDQVAVIPARGDAAALNSAVRAVRGDYLLFLSPEAEPLTPDGLRALLMYAQRPDVGAVGAKLHDKGRVTHAGIAVGIDGQRPVDYPYRGKPAQEVGYMGRLCYVQNVTAVSGQCLMLRRELLERLGGLDESAGSLWDVDLCLRLREAGLLNVFDPFAVTRCPAAPAQEAEDLRRFARRWQARIAAGDPYFNLENAYY